LEHKINGQIRYSRFKLVDDTGECQVVTLAEARSIAEEEGLDIMEVATEKKDQLATCKLIDYGKYLYNQKKKQKKNKHHSSVTKEIKLGFHTAEHDVDIKHKKVKEILSKGNKVLYSMDIKGRDKSHMDIARDIMQQRLEKLSEFASFSDVKVSYGKMTRITTTLTSK